MSETRDRPERARVDLPAETPSQSRWLRVGRGGADILQASGHYIAARAVLFTVVGLGAAVISLLTWLSAEVYENVKGDNGLSALDQPALREAISLRTAGNVGAVNVFTQLGGTIGMTIITIAILAVMTVLWRSRTPVVLMVIGVAGSLLMTTVGKDLVGRARPPHAEAIPPYESSWSFPSGHTLNSTVIASLVAYLVILHVTSRALKALAVVLAVVWFVSMGLSRVFLGHHWLTDVLVGWTLGLAWVAVVITAHRLFLIVRRGRRRDTDDRPAIDAGGSGATA